MKKITYKLIIAITIIFVIPISACKKSFLDKEPLGSTNESTLATKAGVNSLLMGAYNYMANGWLYNADFLFAEIPTDDANFGSYGSASIGMECFTFDANFPLLQVNGRHFIPVCNVQMMYYAYLLKFLLTL